jgi:hypothetical protein
LSVEFAAIGHVEDDDISALVITVPQQVAVRTTELLGEVRRAVS